MKRQAWMVGIVVLALSGQACDARSLSSAPAAKAGAAPGTDGGTNQKRAVMTLRIRLGEGFQNNTVDVQVDGKQVYRCSGVSTDWTISRADGLDVQTEAGTVQLAVSVEGGPRVVQAIEPAQTPFVEVRYVNGDLQLVPQAEEPPML